jgi:hypothetical protein
MSPRMIITIVIAALFLLPVAGFLILLATGSAGSATDLLGELAKTLLQLALIVVVGAYVTTLFAGYAATRAAEETKYRNLVQALESLSTSYWQVKKALYIILAHRSAKSYGEQIRQIVDLRLDLQRLDNEISSGMYPPIQSKGSVTCNLGQLDKCLGRVIDEWKHNYWRLSQLQNQDETAVKPEDRRVPAELDRLPELTAAISHDFVAIHQPFEDAANEIRAQIRRQQRSLGVDAIDGDEGVE